LIQIERYGRRLFGHERIPTIRPFVHLSWLYRDAAFLGNCEELAGDARRPVHITAG
jgi:hypothetical protein